MQFKIIVGFVFLIVLAYMAITMIIGMFLHFPESMFYSNWVRYSSYGLIPFSILINILLVRMTQIINKFIVRSIIVLFILVAFVLTSSLLLPKVVELQYYNGVINDTEDYGAWMIYAIRCIQTAIFTIPIVLVGGIFIKFMKKTK